MVSREQQICPALLRLVFTFIFVFFFFSFLANSIFSCHRIFWLRSFQFPYPKRNIISPQSTPWPQPHSLWSLGGLLVSHSDKCHWALLAWLERMSSLALMGPGDCTRAGNHCLIHHLTVEKGWTALHIYCGQKTLRDFNWVLVSTPQERYPRPGTLNPNAGGGV